MSGAEGGQGSDLVGMETINIDEPGTSSIGTSGHSQESPQRKRKRIGTTERDTGQMSWQERMSTIGERIRHSFMNDELSDVTFIVGPGKVNVPCHKTLLCFCSPVFQAQFNGPLSRINNETEGPTTVEISDMEAETFINFMSFLYRDDLTDRSKATVKDYLDLLYPAKKYLVPALSRLCVEELMDKLQPGNVFQIYETAMLYDEVKLMNCCVRYMNRMCEKIIQTPEFLNLHPSMLSVFLESDGLGASEQQIHRAVLRWAEAKLAREGEEKSPESIRNALGQLIYLVRFPTMSPIEFSQEERDSVLRKEEVIEIYRQICCTDHATESQFGTLKRHLDCKIYVASRFPRESIEPHDINIAREAAYKFQIDFRTDKRIFLNGVSLFTIVRSVPHAFSNDSVKFEIEFAVHVEDLPRVRKLLEVKGDLVEEESKKPGRTPRGPPTFRPHPHPSQFFKVLLDEPCEVPANRSVLIFVEVVKTESRRMNLQTYFGRTGGFEVPRHYEVRVDCPEDDRQVTFQFRNPSNTELGVYSTGQIPEILFSL